MSNVKGKYETIPWKPFIFIIANYLKLSTADGKFIYFTVSKSSEEKMIRNKTWEQMCRCGLYRPFYLYNNITQEKRNKVYITYSYDCWKTIWMGESHIYYVCMKKIVNGERRRGRDISLLPQTAMINGGDETTIWFFDMFLSLNSIWTFAWPIQREHSGSV